MVNASLQHHNLTALFDIVLAREDVTNHKPHPDIVDKALNALQGKKEESIIIGDSKSDLGAAQNAHIDSILFYPEHNHIYYDFEKLKSYKPTYIVTEFKKILDIL